MIRGRSDLDVSLRLGSYADAWKEQAGMGEKKRARACPAGAPFWQPYIPQMTLPLKLA